jgi:hypothetical protein
VILAAWLEISAGGLLSVSFERAETEITSGGSHHHRDTKGSARFRGTLSGATVSPKPVSWIVQPPGYEIFDFIGALPSAGRDTFSGKVIGAPACTTFTVHKAA